MAQAYPDTLVGTDSHTTMINGLGVLGWGVGGIEAEAAMLGQPVSMLIPQVVGFKLIGQVARRRDRDRPRAHGHADAAQEGRRRQVRRVLSAPGWRDCRLPTAPPSPTWPRSTARRAASSRSTPKRCATCARPAAAERAGRAGRSVLQGAGPVPRCRTRPRRLTPTRSNSTSPRSSRAWPARAGRRTACRSPTVKQSFAEALPKLKATAKARPSLGTTLPVVAAGPTPAADRPFGGGPVTHRAEDRSDVRPASLRRRLGRHRRDHQLHEHVEPVRDDRRRPAGQEGGREGAHDEAVGEDEPRARLEGGDRLPDRRRA